MPYVIMCVLSFQELFAAKFVHSQSSSRGMTLSILSHFFFNDVEVQMDLNYKISARNSIVCWEYWKRNSSPLPPSFLERHKPLGQTEAKPLWFSSLPFLLVTPGWVVKACTFMPYLVFLPNEIIDMVSMLSTCGDSMTFEC